MAAKHKKTSLWISNGLFGIFLGTGLVLSTSCFSKDMPRDTLPIYKKNTGGDPASQNKSPQHPSEATPLGRRENIQQSFTPVEITEGRHGAAPQTLVDGAYKGALFKEF